MDNQLVQFDIVGLHGVRDYSILFEDNKVIIVGENGSGKTTVFKIMYHTLSCDWDSLRTFDFECVSLHFGNDKVVQISSDLLQSIFRIFSIASLNSKYLPLFKSASNSDKYFLERIRPCS